MLTNWYLFWDFTMLTLFISSRLNIYFALCQLLISGIVIFIQDI